MVFMDLCYCVKSLFFFAFRVCIYCICFKGKASENQRSRLSIFLFLSCMHTYGLRIIRAKSYV